ncbi:exodeoxyribonuclease III [Corynebacterium sp. H130]|uniref:exodeoxyribonuclease III n=1 Tax=Corynebacterium sp. H130 TaxID=3133444 RepID=UPI00309B7F99
MTFTVSSINVNGIRAAVKERSETNRGFLPWLDDSAADVVLLQEVRATDKQTRDALASALDKGWHYEGAEAAAKGRAGVGILSRTPLSDVKVGIPGFEDSGRFIQAKVGAVNVASLYLPSGSADTEKQDEKYEFLDSFGEELVQLAMTNPLMVIGGDWNICHRREDLKNWKSNQKKSGFLADERAFMDSVFGCFPDEISQVEAHGAYLGAVNYASDRPRRQPAVQPLWFDVARRLQPEDAPYTWWTYRGQAFDTGAGWRIDYQAATADMLKLARRTWVDKAAAYDLRWSDHAPLNVEYDTP